MMKITAHTLKDAICIISNNTVKGRTIVDIERADYCSTGVFPSITRTPVPEVIPAHQVDYPEGGCSIFFYASKDSTGSGLFLDQVQYAVDRYMAGAKSVCLIESQPSDVLLKIPPCLRFIDTRVVDRRLDVFPSFGRMDLHKDFRAMIGAVEAIKRDIAIALGVKCGRTCATIFEAV